MSFDSLEKIESKLQSYKNGDEGLSYICQELVNITKVYNENVTYMNKEITSYKRPEYPSFEELNKGLRFNPEFYVTSEKYARAEYDNDKAGFAFYHTHQVQEVGQLKQIGFLCNTLTQKITRVFDQLRKFDSIAEQIPSFELLQPNLMLALCAPQLRVIKDAQTTVTTSSVTTEITKPTPFDVTLVS